MADKPINSLPQATEIADNDSFVLEQNAAAKRLTGKTLLEVLLRKLDGHGGIKSIDLWDSNSFTLEDTYAITYTDGSTQMITIKNGRGIALISLTSYDKTTDTYTIVYNDSTTSTFEVRHGSDGKDGKNAYVWIRYASQMPSDSSPSFATSPDRWIGVYSGSESSAPTEWSAYDWYDMKGERGVAIYRVNGTNKPLERYSYSDLIMPYGYKPLVNDLVVTTDGYLCYVSQVFDDAELVDVTSTDISINGKSAYQYAVEAGYEGSEEAFAADLAGGGKEVVIYGVSDYFRIYDAILNGRPVYCWYDLQYYLPLMSWDESIETAIFGGCYDSQIITCKAVGNEWSVNIAHVSTSEPEVFVGTENTTVAEFNEAFASGKPCFLRKANAGEGIVMWVAYTCNTSQARFYRIGNGFSQHGVLSSDGTFVVTNWNHTTLINETSTDNQIPTAKAVYDLVKTKGSGIYVLSEGENLEDVPEDVSVVIDPYGEPDMSVEQVVAAALEVIEYGTY